MADPSRATQCVLLALVESSPAPRTTQAATLALSESGGKPRGTQALVQALVERTPATRATQATVIAIANLPSKSRATQAATLTLGESSPAPRVSQALGLVLKDKPYPIRVTQGLTLKLGETDPRPRATQALVQKLGNTTARPRATQALVQKVGRTTASPRATACVALVLTRDNCISDAVRDGELTFEMLKRRLATMLGENRDALVYWTEAEMERLLNDSYRTLCRDTGAYEFVQTQNTVAGTADYTLDATTARVLSVYWDNWVLRPILQWELDRKTGTPHRPDQTWGYVETADQTIKLVDTPASVAVLKVWASGIPADMSLYCDIPQIPCWTHVAVAYGAAATALERRGEHGDLAASAAYRGLYGEYEALLKAHLATRTPEKTYGLR